MRRVGALFAITLVALATAVPAWAQPYPPQEPTCQVNKTTVQPNEQITVTGDDWQANSSVQMRFRQGNDDQVYGPFPTDATGHVSATITVPADAKEGHAKLVVGGPDSRGKRFICTLDLTVQGGGGGGGTTICAIDDATPAPGQTVKVSGRQWQERSDVTITFRQGGGSEPMGTAGVNGAGRFATGQQIPGDANDGAAIVRVQGNDSDGNPQTCDIAITVSSSSSRETAGFTLARPITPGTLGLLLGVAAVVVLSRRRRARALLRSSRSR